VAKRADHKKSKTENGNTPVVFFKRYLYYAVP